jgi:hypothetical protein
MPKPLKFPTKVLIGFDDDRLSAVDAWRRQQDDLPTRSEAIRRLTDLALAVAGQKVKPHAKAHSPRKQDR